MPLTTFEKGGKLVIVNLQKTPLDYAASLIIHGKCDEVMRLLMQKLEYDIPEWRLQRRFQIEQTTKQNGDKYLKIRGVDVNLSPYSLFTKIKVKPINGQKTPAQELKKEPFSYLMADESEKYNIELFFQGHYEEPSYNVELDLKELKDNNNLQTYLMVYNPFLRVWEFCVTI